MCEQRKHGSVGAGAGNRPGYPTDGVRVGGVRRPFEGVAGGGMTPELAVPVQVSTPGPLQVATLSRDGKERCRLTDWGRRGFGVLIVTAAWEQTFVQDRVPIATVDAVVALLGILPLVRLPEDASGLCTLTASVEPGDGARPPAAMVWAKVRHGRVVACAEGAPRRQADAWASGAFSAWLAALIENRDALQSGGDRELAGAIVNQPHIQLYRQR